MRRKMRTTHLLEDLEFHEPAPYSQPLYVDEHGRVLRFTLKPGQRIAEHAAPHSPFYVVVLQGHGMFAGADGQEEQFGPHALLIFDPGEQHTVRALDEELVFVGFLHGVPGTRPGQIGGVLGRAPD
jgi:quercetin dioxygenase-like cupin family protein